MTGAQPMSVPVVQCRATSRAGKQRKNKAIPGGTVCRFHGGASPDVDSKAAVRAEVMNWGLGDTKGTQVRCYFDWCPNPLLERSASPTPRGGVRSRRTS